LGGVLKDVWHDRNVSVNGLFASTVTADRRSAALWKIEELVLSILTGKLRDAGLGNDAVLFQQGDFVLTAARLNGHTTDRVTVKSQTVTERKRFLRKPETVHVIVLDVDYAEKGRWGEYETLELECKTEEEARQFTDALVKARMIGCFNGFLGRLRQLV
jgi:hypothetical protein